MAGINNIVSFKDFVRHPFFALMFLMIVAISSMYIRDEIQEEKEKERLNNRITELEDKYDDLNALFIETVTELKHHEE